MELNLNTLKYYIFDKKFKVWMNSEKHQKIKHNMQTI